MNYEHFWFISQKGANCYCGQKFGLLRNTMKKVNLEHLVPLPKLDIIICPFLDYYILSIFHNLGSPLSYHT